MIRMTVTAGDRDVCICSIAVYAYDELERAGERLG